MSYDCRSDQLSDIAKGSRRQVIVAGGIAGLISRYLVCAVLYRATKLTTSRFCIAPLDVIKIRLQLQTHCLDPLKHGSHGAFPIIKAIWHNYGVTVDISFRRTIYYFPLLTRARVSGVAIFLLSFSMSLMVPLNSPPIVRSRQYSSLPPYHLPLRPSFRALALAQWPPR